MFKDFNYSHSCSHFLLLQDPDCIVISTNNMTVYNAPKCLSQKPVAVYPDMLSVTNVFCEVKYEN